MGKCCHKNVYLKFYINKYRIETNYGGYGPDDNGRRGKISSIR